jgi:nucleotide-binding universal stress UspA family protein
MYEKILVAVDYSPPATRALAAARDLAELSHGEVWVLHLWERELASKVGAIPPDETAGEAKTAMDASLDVLRKAGITAHGEVRTTFFGYAGREIVNDAKEHDVDVIVMGSRGRGDLSGLVLGSTAHKVIHLTDRPVLVVR